jgi:hypothetical protein
VSGGCLPGWLPGCLLLLLRMIEDTLAAYLCYLTLIGARGLAAAWYWWRVEGQACTA